MAPKADTEIDTLFIDDNNIFAKDELTDENTEVIKTLLDRSNYASNIISSDEEDDQQDLIQTDLTSTGLVGDSTRTDDNLPFETETLKIKPAIDVVPKEEIDLRTIDPTINVTTENGDDYFSLR